MPRRVLVLSRVLEAMGSHAVTVHASDIVAASLHERSPTLARLDVWPLALAYATLAAAAARGCGGRSARAHAHVLPDATFACSALSLVPAAVAGGCLLACHLLLLLCAMWFVDVAAWLRCRAQPAATRATLVKLTPAQFAGAPALLPLQRRVRAGGADAAAGREELFFEFRKQRFVWHAADGCFREQRCPTALPFAAYAASRGLATPAAAAEAAAAHGANSFAIPLPPFMELLLQQLSAPFFVFQLFCVALWCLDEYWQYSIFTLLMLILFEATVVTTRQRTARELRSQGAPAQHVLAHRAGAWQPLPPAELLPGDLVSIGASVSLLFFDTASALILEPITLRQGGRAAWTRSAGWCRQICCC